MDVHKLDELGDRLLAVGTTMFTLGLNGPDYDLGPVRDWLDWRDERNAATA